MSLIFGRTQEQRDHYRFTAGDCHILARAINRLTGWPIYAFDDRGPDLHVFVKMPDGRALDVDGACSMRTMKRRWDAESDYAVREFDWAEFRREWCMSPMFGSHSYRRAKVIATDLIAKYA